MTDLPAKTAAPRKLGRSQPATGDKLEKIEKGEKPEKGEKLASQEPPKKKKKKGFFRWLFGWIWFLTWTTSLILLVAGIVGGYFLYQQALIFQAQAAKYDLSQLDKINVTSRFYDINGEEIGRLTADEDRILLKTEDVPERLRQAILSAEDRRYYNHGAIDVYGIARAGLDYVLVKGFGRHYRLQGGSTIEQQLAKHLIGNFSRTIDRKVLESFVAYRMEQKLSKDQILTYYMNRIYFGNNYYGVGAAARGYFGKDVKDLTVPECALLAGIIRAPVSSCPRTNIKSAKQRRDLTLNQMAGEGYITQDDALKYEKEPIVLAPAKPAGLQSFVMNAAVRETKQILNIKENEDLPPGLTVTTNINLKLQSSVEDMLNDKLDEVSSQGGEDPSIASNAPKKAPLQGGVMVAEVDTGRVRAYVGGRDFAHNQYDHITQARRETGALLQPVIYSLAFDRLGLHPASMVNASYIDPAGTVKAADMDLGDPAVDVSKYFLTVQDAMSLGNKAAAARVGLRLGATNVTNFFRKVGLTLAAVPSDKPNTFIPDPMTLSDVMMLYRTIANEGVTQEASGDPTKFRIIHSIKNLVNDTIYLDSLKELDTNSPVISPLVAQQMSLTLESALRASPGPGHSLAKDNNLNCGVAGMAGFSEGYRDSWFVGYTPKLITGVWIGYDDSRPLGGKEKALSASAPLWGEVVQQADTMGLNLRTPFTVPPELTKVEVDRSTGAMRGLAGLAPEPGCIFCYLKKDLIAQPSAGLPAQQRLGKPHDWTSWLSSYYSQADETQFLENPLTEDDTRSNIIPALAQYKMPGLRGDIIAADGKVYATMTSEKNLMLSWPAADEATDAADVIRWMRARLNQIQSLLGVPIMISDDDLAKTYKILRFQPLFVLEDITPDQVKKVQDAGWLNKGFGIQTVPRREYPQGKELAHMLGYLARDQRQNRTGKYLSGDCLYDRYKGAAGLELIANGDLTGTDGEFDVATTPEGYIRTAAVKIPSTPGNNVRITIDGQLQSYVENALNLDKLDAAVMMDVNTGDVVAIASHPSYDPNLFVPAISIEDWQALNKDPSDPLISRAISAQYPPGSCFKVVTSIAAMRAGVFDPDWVVHCTGTFDIGNVTYHLPLEHGDVTYLEALKHSFNTYFMTLGLKVGRDILLDTARSLGLGSPTNIGLPGEASGRIPDPEFERRVNKREFGPGDLTNTSIGQGDVLVTPLQMASLMAAVANGGTVYQPRLIKQVEDLHGNIIKAVPVAASRSNDYSDKYMANLKEAMIGVVDDGTATVVHRDDMKIAAKTGTAQVPYKGKPRQIAWLCGYLPADNPKYSFAVMVEGTVDEDLHGGVHAGAIAKAIFDAMYDKKPGDTVPSQETAPAAAPATNYTTVPAGNH